MIWVIAAIVWILAVAVILAFFRGVARRERRPHCRLPTSRPHICRCKTIRRPGTLHSDALHHRQQRHQLERIPMKKFLIGLFLCLTTPALGQVNFATVDGETTQSIVIMCLNSSNQAVPFSSTNCVSGGGGSNASVGTTGTTIPGSATYVGMLQSGVLTGLTGTGGSLNVNITGGGGSGGTSSNFGAAFPAAGTAIGLTNGTDMIAWSATTTYASSPGAIAVPAVNAAVTTSVLPTGAATSALQTTGNTSLSTIATNSGTQATAALQATGNTSAATTATNTTAISGASGTTADAPCTLPASTAACSAVAVQKAIANAANSAIPIGSASGGISTKTLATLSNSAIPVKAAAGQVYSGQCSNQDATHWAFIQIFNVAAASVTMGTTPPTKFVGIPPGSNAGFTFSLVGLQYSTAISAGAATTSTGGTAPTTALDCTVDFN